MPKGMLGALVVALTLGVAAQASAASEKKIQPWSDDGGTVVAGDARGTAAEPEPPPTTRSLPPTRHGIDLVGKARVHDAAPGRVADVAVLNHYAYLAGWREPLERCETSGGFYVMDIRNPANPQEVTFVQAPRGTYLTEGMHAIHLNTPQFTGDILVVSNETCPNETPGVTVGGISIYDITNPRSPQPLRIGYGDTTPGAPRAHESHSAFAWQAGNRAFVIAVDNEEIQFEPSPGDVDIFEITDPRNPVLIRETGLADWPQAQDVQSRGMGNSAISYHHDSVVKRIGNRWIGSINYWDAGYILLDLTDPANPVFLNHSTYPTPDPFSGLQFPEGNAHQSEFEMCPEAPVKTVPTGCSRMPRYLLGADEDFDPFRLVIRITSGAFAGTDFNAGSGSDTPPILPHNPVSGPTYYIGRACTPESVPAAPAGNAIAVAERGDCFFTVKAQSAEARGYQAIVIFNNPPNCEATLGMLVEANIPALGVLPRSRGYQVLNIPGYNPANCPTGGPNPPLPAPGTQGANLTLSTTFDGWGELQLIDTSTSPMQKVDTYFVREARDPRFAEGQFGDLSIHEIATDPTHRVGYVAYYAAGARVVDWSSGRFVETGRFIDDRGTDMWGTQVWITPDGRRYFLQSDRDYGLYVFRYGTDLAVRSRARASNRNSVVTYTQTVTNRGTIDSTGTTLRTTLPRGLRVTSLTASQGSCRLAGRQVVCNLGRLTAKGGSAQVRIVARATTAGVKRATAATTSPQVDYDPRSNRARSQARLRVAVTGVRAGGPALTGRPR